MSVNQRHIDASPEAVFAVLSDPDSYEHWVVGSSRTFQVDGSWPDVGATFHHRQGLPVIGPKDTTTVLEVDAPRHLRLCVRVRPYLVGEVALTLEPRGGGTEVTMVETPVGGVLAKLPRALLDAALKARNVETLRRLAKISA
jgi:uncharacterized protein YndB with AHSA1/START domain